MPPATDCPDDAVMSISADVEDGEIAKAYRIAVLQLRECSGLRQKVLDKYRQIAAQDAKKIEGLVSKTNDDGPFGSSSPTADNAGAPTIKLSPEDQKRQLGIDVSMRKMEKEFSDLSSKTYNIEGL